MKANPQLENARKSPMHTDFQIRYFGLGWILCILAFAVGCLSPAVHKNVPAFANAVTLVTEKQQVGV